jgi:Short C-terminal domain
MFVRRRPLLRAAAVGGGAYMAGKRRAQRSAMEQDQDSGQDQGGAEQAPPVPRQSSGPPSMSDQLKQLSDMHASGALSDDEFAAAKSRILS